MDSPKPARYGRQVPSENKQTLLKKGKNIPGPSNRSPPATFRSGKASRGDLLEGAGRENMENTNNHPEQNLINLLYLLAAKFTRKEEVIGGRITQEHVKTLSRKKNDPKVFFL